MLFWIGRIGGVWSFRSDKHFQPQGSSSKSHDVWFNLTLWCHVIWRGPRSALNYQFSILATILLFPSRACGDLGPPLRIHYIQGHINQGRVCEKTGTKNAHSLALVGLTRPGPCFETLGERKRD